MPQKYTIEVTFESEVPEAWMRAWLDDMFSDEAISHIADTEASDLSSSKFRCRDCAAVYDGGEVGFITECPDCGGGLLFIPRPMRHLEESPGEVETAELNTDTPD